MVPVVITKSGRSFIQIKTRDPVHRALRTDEVQKMISLRFDPGFIGKRQIELHDRLRMKPDISEGFCYAFSYYASLTVKSVFRAG